MIVLTIYVVIALILCFVLFIAFKAINTGMEAKKEKKKIYENELKSPTQSDDLLSKLNNLNELYEKGALSEEEFRAAKEKILNN